MRTRDAPRFGTVRELDLQDRTVLIRVDFNVPIADGEIVDDARIRATLPTIDAVLKQRGTRLVLFSHLGRPSGAPDKTLSMAPIARRLAELVKARVMTVDDCIGPKVIAAAAQLGPGEILMLENVRFHPGEEANDERFAAELAELGDVYLNDAFGAAHRAHASTVGVPARLPPEAKGAGLLMERELAELGSLLLAPATPFVLAVGGAKVSSKIGVLKHLLHRVDAILIGGGMAYTFLTAQGVSVGASFVEQDAVKGARELLDMASARGIPVLLPTDHVATGSQIGADSDRKDIVLITTREIPEGLIGADIGPRTVRSFRDRIERAGTVFWNGPMGVAEIKAFQRGTLEVAQSVVRSNAHSVVGGGDSLAALATLDVTLGIDHISTGGGASLELLEGRVLPGVEALYDDVSDVAR